MSVRPGQWVSLDGYGDRLKVLKVERRRRRLYKCMNRANEPITAAHLATKWGTITVDVRRVKVVR